MVNSKRLLTVLSASAILACSSNAFAAFDGPFISAHGGGNLTNDLNIGSRPTLDFHAGLQAGVAVGYKTGALRYELEYGYRRNSIDKYRVDGVQQAGESGHTALSTGLINVLYNFEQLSANWYPYVGMGVGLAHLANNARATGLSYSTSNSNEFAFQGVLGMGYKLARSFSLEADYRFLGTTKFHFTNTSGGNAGSPYYSNGVNVGLLFSF